MTDPIVFDTTTQRFSLPLLFAGQAQKEAFVNESLSLVDALLHPVVEGIANTPPASPTDGTTWIIGTSPGGAWSGLAGKLVCRQSGQWLFLSPTEGMRVYDRTAGQDLRQISGNWIAATVPTAPSGGTTVDSQARDAIANMLQCLRDAGIVPAA